MQACQQMVDASLIFLLGLNLKGYTIYAHNFSKFDGIILLYFLGRKSRFEIKPVFRDNKVFLLEILEKDKETRRTRKLLFQDSFLILPHKLEKLAEAFECETKKGSFPHNFSSFETLNYIGPKPSDRPLTEQDHSQPSPAFTQGGDV
jgi:hypothetical protein